MKHIFYILFLLVISNNVYAGIPGKAWTGDGELYIDDKLHCSYDASKNPRVLKWVHNGYFTTHIGGDNWIWPKISKGCAFGWLGYIPLQIKNGDLVSVSGKTVGTITTNKIEAKEFYNEPSEVYIKSLLIQSFDMENVTIEVEFTHPTENGVFKFISTMKRHRDSIWP